MTNKLLCCCAGLVAGIAVISNAAVAATEANLDFETTQYPNNFRVLNANGATISQTANGVANDFMRSVNGSGASVVYDANGSTAGISSFTVSSTASLTVSADVSFNTGNNSFGIYIVNASNEAQGYLAIFNVNASGANDQIRFASNAAPSTSGAGTLGAGSFANNADVGIAANSLFSNISLTYGINESNNPVLTLTAGSQTSSISLTSITSPFTNVEIGFRFGSSAGTVAMDNLVISTASAVPEPSSFAALAGIAALGVCFTRRRAVR